MDVDDLMEALRSKDVFNPAVVEYAIIETNGSMTVLPKSTCKPLCPENVNIDVERAYMPVTLILEGNFLGNNLSVTDGVTKQGIMKLLSKINMESKDVLLLLLQGSKVFVQPYNGDSLTVNLERGEQ
jgi:uncharacterized membrane protein YcaP (DUF421 family)